MNIIESISEDGVKTTPAELAHTRLTHPHPGDIVDLGENEGTYPFTSGKYGRIDDTNSWGTGCISICCEMGDAYLSKDGTVSISGGPFTTVAPEELTPAMFVRSATYWNWGDRGSGAGHGVYYTFERPVFILKKRTEESAHTVTERFNKAR